MAHELAFTDGVADFFEVGATRSAWHREGVHLTEAPSLADAVRIARLDYPVVKQPTYIVAQSSTAPDGDEVITYTPSAKAFITRRMDTGAELGSVGPDYQPLQNLDAFRALEPLLDAGVLRLETGGVLRRGADAWLLARFDLARFGPVVREVFADEVVPYALVANNHTGRRNATVALTPIRVVCANTLGAAEAEQDAGLARALTVRHTGDVEARIVEAARTLFAGIVERYETVAALYRRLKARQLDEALFRTLVVDVVAPDPRCHRAWNPDARMASAVAERHDRKVAELTRLWTDGAGHIGDRSAWEAYNAAVEALDHNAELWPTRSGVYRTQSLLSGQLGATKRAVLASLAAHCGEG